MTESTLPQRVTDLWLDDGNLIIIAGIKVFRLYQGLLARRSSIFKDILSIPQLDAWSAIDAADRLILQQLGEDAGGCAVVRLTDDPQEVEWFLAAFFADNLATSSKGKSQYTGNLAALTGILRLAAKYDVGFLRSWAVCWLENYFPIDDDSLLQDVSYKGLRPTSIDGYLPLMNLALAVDVPWILPRVYWRLHHASLSQVMNHPEWAHLSEAHRMVMLLAREAVREDDISNPIDTFLTVSQETPGHPRDTDHEEEFERVILAILKYDGARGYYCMANSVLKALWRTVGIVSCPHCMETFRVSRVKLLNETFASVQKHYGLPDPETLERMRSDFHRESDAWSG